MLSTKGEAKSIKVLLPSEAGYARPLTLLRTDPPESRRRSFALGFVLQIAFILLLVRLAAYTPLLVRPQVRQSVQLIAPTFRPQAPVKPVHITTPPIPKVKLPPTAAPEVQPPPVVAKAQPIAPIPAPPVPSPAVTRTPPIMPPTPAPPKPVVAEVKTNVFAAPASEPTTKAPARQVQTGSFGDENGFRGQTDATAKLNAPKLGSFDRAAGLGDGNGAGGANGRPGVIASAGFGSGTVAAVSETPGGGIHAGGFGDARVAGGGTGTQAKSNSPAVVPVEILEKPQPQYTQEARNLKIEGEVHLKVTFQADGHVQVLQVVRGLGHGLDEAATAAAQKIRFRPAQRDGRPCDMTATVHIVFQLAS